MADSELPNVELGDVDGEHVPVTTCVCGATYKGWDVVISIYPNDATPMPCCGRRLYFRQKLTVYEVTP